jgi:hypothetical protein
VAEREGTTSHNFILEAVAEKTDVAEQRDAGIAASRKTVPWPEMRRYLESRGPERR